MRTNAMKERVAARVARRLVADIRRRRLGPGTQLDPEHVMVEDFGVARGTLREALRFLELQGALRIKAGPGGGPVVSVPGADHLASVLSLHLQFADASFRSVVDARRSIYPVLTGEAAEQAGPDDHAALRECVARIHDSIGDEDGHREETRRLHSLIAAASRNRVLALLVEALHRMSEVTGPWDEKQQRAAVRSYEKIVEAIAAGDAETARTTMERTITSALRHWERTEPDVLERPVSWIDLDD